MNVTHQGKMTRTPNIRLRLPQVAASSGHRTPATRKEEKRGLECVCVCVCVCVYGHGLGSAGTGHLRQPDLDGAHETKSFEHI